MRRRHYPLLTLALAALALSAQVSGQESGTLPVEIEWGPVTRARGYVLQVRAADGGQVRTIRSFQTRVSVPLTPGSYERRVAALNKFGKVSYWSAWAVLNVRLTRVPEIEDVTPPVVRAERFGLHRIAVRGRGFLVGLSAAIRGPERDLAIVELKRIDEENLELLVDANQASAGTYEILLRNPGNMEARRPSALLLTHEPEAVAKRELAPAAAMASKESLETESFGAREENRPAAVSRADSPVALLKKTEEPPKRTVRADIPIWQALVPGLPQLLRGDGGRAWFYWGAIGGLAIGGGAAWLSAEMKAGSEGSSPLFQTFNNPIVYFGVRDTLLSSQAGILLYQAGQQEFSRSIDRYHRSQRLAAGAAATILVAYAVHLWDAFRPNQEPDGKPATNKAAAETRVQLLFGLGGAGKEGRGGTLGVQVSF